MSPRLAERKTGHMLPDGTALISFGERYRPSLTKKFTDDGRLQEISFNISGEMAVHMIIENRLFLQECGKGDRKLVELLLEAATTLKRVIDETTSSKVFTLKLAPEEVAGFSDERLIFRSPDKAIEFAKTVLVSDLRFGGGFSREREGIIETILQTAEVLKKSLSSR